MMSTRMKMFFTLVLLYLAANNGLCAPTKARYMFVKCRPDGDQANCLTHKSSPLKLDPDLPSRLPSSAAQYLEAEAVQEEEWPELEGEGPEPDWKETEFEGEGPVTDLEETGLEGEGPVTDSEQPELDGERPVTEEESVTEVGESQTSLLFPEEGSGGSEEGSAVWPDLMSDRAFIPAETEVGSGDTLREYKLDPEQGEQRQTLKLVKDKPETTAQELKEDHLLL